MKQMEQLEIAYQNKDITSKVLADGSVAIVDYESGYDKADKIKYLNYLAGIASRYHIRKTECPILRMIVIYTGDVHRSQASAVYNIGAVQVNVEPAFLSELDAESIFQKLKEKVAAGQMLTDEELMEFIILPLSYRRKEDKRRQVRKSVRLAAGIRDRGQQVFTLAGILAFTDKIIDRETADEIRKEIGMTKVAMIFEREKQEALAEAAKVYEKEKQEALEKSITRMIQKNYDTEEIVSLFPDFSHSRVEALRQELAAGIKDTL